MANVNPTLKMTPRAVNPTRFPARARQSGTTPDFRQLLTREAAQPGTSTPPRTIGTVTAGLAGPVPPAPVVNEPAMAPTAQALFGANPWIMDAGGHGMNGSYSYNKYYFATPETAAKVAAMLGGKVVAVNDITPFGPFVQNQANQMVQMPDGRLINAGIIASYYDRGWTQQMVDRLVSCETGNLATGNLAT